jgi:uncharacterized membrane protein YkvA (DUF1232 family)
LPAHRRAPAKRPARLGLRNKRNALALWFPRRHPNAPWLAKLLVLAVVAYALI